MLNSRGYLHVYTSGLRSTNYSLADRLRTRETPRPFQPLLFNRLRSQSLRNECWRLRRRSKVVWRHAVDHNRWEILLADALLALCKQRITHSLSSVHFVIDPGQNYIWQFVREELHKVCVCDRWDGNRKPCHSCANMIKSRGTDIDFWGFSWMTLWLIFHVLTAHEKKKKVWRYNWSHTVKWRTFIHCHVCRVNSNLDSSFKETKRTLWNLFIKHILWRGLGPFRKRNNAELWEQTHGWKSARWKEANTETEDAKCWHGLAEMFPCDIWTLCCSACSTFWMGTKASCICTWTQTQCA